jgi:hypothetical protein
MFAAKELVHDQLLFFAHYFETQLMKVLYINKSGFDMGRGICLYSFLNLFTKYGNVKNSNSIIHIVIISSCNIYFNFVTIIWSRISHDW